MKHNTKRVLALTLTTALSAALLSPAALAADAALSPSFDESYYATLDYYGGLMDSSVVKSFQTRGQSKLTDYGVYDEVINLTDDRTPTISDGTVTFDLGEDTPNRFYFEGKTDQPFRELPWTISVSYLLNGAPAQAEDLAGKTGLVEIDLDVVPNPAASEYSRNNLVLTAATAFNDDDILSLEAPGAQVQLLGNLRAVLFAVFPGEEQHFAIRVGSDSFTFPGLALLAVPATLQQLDQVADLREAKEKVEDSYDAINASLDVILNSLDGMSGSLNATANGLDQLNSARGTISAGKDPVYDKAELAISDLDGLAGALGSMDGYLDSTAQALTDTTASLNQLNSSVQSLKPELENTRNTIASIQKDTKALSQLLTDVESYNKKATAIASSLADEMDDLDDEMEDLQLRLNILESALKSPGKISTVSAQELTSKLTVAGTIDPDTGKDITVAKLLSNIENAQKLQAAYEGKIQELMAANSLTEEQAKAQLSFDSFLKAYFVQAGYDDSTAAAKSTAVQQLLYAVENDSSTKATLAELNQTLNTAGAGLDALNTRIREANSIITNLTGPTASLVDSLSELCETTGSSGMTDDLTALAQLCRDLLKTMKTHEGEGASLLGHVDELGSLASRVSQTAEDSLDHMNTLNGVLNTYEPQLQQALSDAKTLSGSAQSTLHDTGSALSSAEALMRQSSQGLDNGTRQTLSGLSDALRRSTTGLSQTGTIRNAKDTITDLIDDEWDTHTGGDNNLLLMDAGAAPLSMTDTRNPSPNNIQYIMRTQEIKLPDDTSEASDSQEAADNGTFLGRVAGLFKGLWNDFTGLFHKG